MRQPAGPIEIRGVKPLLSPKSDAGDSCYWSDGMCDEPRDCQCDPGTDATVALIAGMRESAPGRMNKSITLPRRPRLLVGGILQAVTAWPTLVRPWTSAGFAMGVVSRQVSVTAMATS